MKCPAAQGVWTGDSHYTGYLANYTTSESSVFAYVPVACHRFCFAAVNVRQRCTRFAHSLDRKVLAEGERTQAQTISKTLTFEGMGFASPEVLSEVSLLSCVVVLFFVSFRCSEAYRFPCARAGNGSGRLSLGLQRLPRRSPE